MDKLLGQLVDKLRKAHGQDLVSVILYGSAVETAQHDAEYSDINILCVLREVTAKQLARSQPVFAWWGTYEKPAPLLLSEHEVASSTDCFAIEFRDMQQRRRVLSGPDVIKGLVVENTFYRAQVEYELRSKLLRLRQKASGALADRKLLGQLLIGSVSTFCVLIRHALLLHGVDAPPERRAILKAAQERFGIDPGPFSPLLDVREKKTKPGAIQPEALLDDYLKQIGIVIDAVDRLEPVTAGEKGEL